MTNKEIIECIESREDRIVKNVKDMIDTYTSNIVTLFTQESQNTRHSINELTSRIDKQNGSIKNLSEWKSIKEGEEKQKEKEEKQKEKTANKVFKIAGIIIACIAIIAPTVIGIINISHNKRLKTEVDMINTPVRTRGGTIEWWPSGVLIDSLNKE